MYKLNPSDEWYKKASEEEDKFLDVGAGPIKEKTGMKILLLEDDMRRVVHFNNRVDELNEVNELQCELIHVETAKDCIEQLENATEETKFNLILLDHDLGGKIYVDVKDENTGSAVARWINSNPEKLYNAFVITHTFNAAGAKNILSLIPGCLYIPAIWLKDNFHNIVKIS